MKRKILGILCDLVPDLNGFYDVTIAYDQPLLFEWIVRGAMTEREAIQSAEDVIYVLLQGGMVRYDAEGRTIPYMDGLEQERRVEIAKRRRAGL